MHVRPLNATTICSAMLSYLLAAEERSLTSKQVNDDIHAPGGGVIMMASAGWGLKMGAIAARPIKACRRPRDRPCTSAWLCLPLQLGSEVSPFAARILTFVCLKG